MNVASVLISYDYGILQTTEQRQNKVSLNFSHSFKFSSGRIWLSNAM